MNPIIKFLITFMLSVIFAFGFNISFLDLFSLPLIDRVSLMFFLSVSLTFVIFSLIKTGRLSRIKEMNFSLGLGSSLREYLPGLIISLIFFCVYLYFGLQFMLLANAQVDNLFEADVASWVRRISGSEVSNFVMRGPHPFTYFILRPFGWILNLFTKDPELSALLLNTLAGSLSIFFAWLFIKRSFSSDIYALLIAGLLGVSASHLFWGSVVETYIFSAMSLILFYLLLETKRSSDLSLILAGILTFGITFTNFIQNGIGFIVKNMRWKEIFRFFAWTISLSIILSFFHAAVYPSSKLFFVFSSARVERKFFNILLNMPEWKALGRTIFLLRTVFLYTTVAPEVYVLREEVGSYIPEFRFFKVIPGTFSYSGYDGLGTVLILIWGIMLLVSGGTFLWNLIYKRKVDMTLAFALSILFNIVLHSNYGQELFLYSPDWAYALIFFVAFGLAPYRENRLFQSAFIVFLIGLTINQWNFMKVIITALLTYQ